MKTTYWIRLLYDLRNFEDLGGCYQASADNTLPDIHNSSDHKKPLSIIVNCFLTL